VDDSQPVEQYDGTLGVTTAFVNAHQSPAGQIQWNDNLGTIYTNPGNVSGVRWCSGTMISSDLFLAAGHCFDQTGGGWTRPKDNSTGTTISPAEIATNMHVNFNYQVDPAGNLRPVQSFDILELVEYRLGGLDFAIVRLDGNPGDSFGITQVSTTDAAVGDMLCIIGHPAGTPKRIEAGPCSSFSGDRIQYDDIDTLGGNSGSGILRASDGRIVGVHTNGGCTVAGTGENKGVRISSMLAQSPTLQDLTSPTVTRPWDRFRATLKYRDEPGLVLKIIDDRVTRKYLDDPPRVVKPIMDRVTRKFTDDGATTKAVDDAKTPALDKGYTDHKMPGMDIPWTPFRYSRPLRAGVPREGRSPFILATPHHSAAWAGGPGAAPHTEAEQLLAEYEEALAWLESVMEGYLAQLTEMDAEYRELLAEHAELTSRYR
jgi:V8-like Glu-specific endopeptidase